MMTSDHDDDHHHHGAPGTLTRDNIAHFNQQAAGWDAKPHIAQLARDMAAHLIQALDLDASTTLLDFGCGMLDLRKDVAKASPRDYKVQHGTGLLSEQLAPRVQQVWGCDTSPAMVAAFQAKAAATGLTNMSAAACDVLDGPAVAAAQSAGALPRAVDVVLSHMTLHHVEQVGPALGALAALLKPGGRLVISDLLQTPDSAAFHVTHTTTVSHHGGFSRQQLEALLEPAGLRLTSFEESPVVMTKCVGPPGGQQEHRDFPIFCAVAMQS